MFKHAGKVLLLLACLSMLSLAGCGTNGLTSRQGNFSNIPLGKGHDPEPGTDGKPKPAPEGHWESLLVANGITYAGSDNGQLYAFDAQSGKLRWQRKQSANYLRASAGNILYAFNQGSSDNTLYALDASNGNVLWQHAVASPIDTVQVENGVVYLNTGNAAHASTVYALQATNGALLWQYNEDGSAEAGLLSIGNGRVYVAPLQQGPGGPNGPQTITVLDASSGQALWHLTLSIQDGNERNGIVEVNGTTYIGTDNGSIYAVQTTNGQVLWHVSQPAITSPYVGGALNGIIPVVVDGVVYVGSLNSISAYRVSDGKQLWQYQVQTRMGGPPFGMQPLVENGVVYFETRPPRASLIALQASDGMQLWQKSNADDASPDELELVDGRLINQVGVITAWQTSDGSLLWTHSTDNGEGPPGPGRPVLTSGDVIYVGGTNGSIQAFQVSDGKHLWHYQIQELPVQEPPIYGAYITFTNATNYDRAIQIISDLGLKTFIECRFEWVPEDGKASYTSGHLLTVVANTNSAPLWLARLQAMPEVAQTQAEGPHGCTLDASGPNPIQRLEPKQAGTYLQVSFADNITYTQAWQSLNALGFRLANPCYEEARAQGNKPTWQPMGEEDSFAQTHTLVIATTAFNAITWQQQLRGVTGIGHVDTLSGTACN